jgi:Glycosyltransferase family 87
VADAGALLRNGLLGLAALALAGRVGLLIHGDGMAGDSQAFVAVLGVWQHDPLHLYGIANPGGDVLVSVWPYPPGFLPWLSVADLVRDSTGIAFHVAIQALPIAADLALAFVVQAYLGLRGATERTRLAAAALVLLCPTIAVNSGYNSQIDSVAILPAAAALLVWERAAPERRALYAGALVGLAATVKLPPALVLLALVPSVASRGELARLVGAALAVPALALLPFLVTDPDGVANAAQYKSLPGVGGLTLIAQPRLAEIWLGGGIASPQDLNGAAHFLFDNGTLIVAGGLLVVFALAAPRRPAPAQMAAILWLAFYAFAPNIFFGYWVWGIPFFLMAGHLAAALALELLVAVPTLLVFRLGTGAFDISTAPGSRGAALYIACMIALSAACLVALTLALRGQWTGSRAAAGLAAP